MNFEKLFNWIIGIVVSYALAGQLTDLNKWVYRAQAKLIYDSRASNWGSPRFFREK